MVTVSDKDQKPATLPSREELLAEVKQLRGDNSVLRETLERRNSYIRNKINQLLNVMGTKPLREEELEDDTLQEFDPLGIIFDSFRHILATLKDKNNQLQLMHDETVAIFSAAQVGIMVVDRDFRIISCNDRMKEIFFTNTDEVAWGNDTCKNLVCKGLVPEGFCAVRKILKGDSHASFKGWEVQHHIFDVEASSIRNSDGSVKRIVLVYKDITDLKISQENLNALNAELEQRVSERTRQLEESNRDLESFCYSVSHDLRAPLRHLSGFANILNEDYGDLLDEEGRGYLKRICSVSCLMGRLIDDLLRISRVSRSAMDFVDIDLSSSAETAVAMLQGSEPERKVTVSIAKGLNVRGDATLLNMAIQNLIGNAWKYSSHNQEAHIEMGKTTVQGKEAFFVRDNGVGFDMTYHDKIFHVFERLHGEEFEGTGIGLATVQRIIGRHNGEIWAESTVGRGATFYFTLPQTN